MGSCYTCVGLRGCAGHRQMLPPMGPLQGSLLPAGGFAAPTRKVLNLSDSSFLQLSNGKAPQQQASPKSQNWNWWDSQNGKNWEQSREVLKDLLVVVRSFGENQKMSSGHPSLTHGWSARLPSHNTFHPFLLCFPRFSPLLQSQASI